MELSQSVICKIMLSRYQFNMSMPLINSDQDVARSTGINILHDSLEVFLLAVAECLNANIDIKTIFSAYFEKINERLKPNELPYKRKLLELNKVRVNSKHHGIFPSRDDCKLYGVTVSEFYDKVSNDYLGKDYNSICLVDVIDNKEVKYYLQEAKNFLEKENYEDCLISCRKALYLSFEKEYDISIYNEDQPKGLMGPFCSAPYWARNKSYIEKNVRQPTDYVTYDHSQLNLNLSQLGISHEEYWNVWRLTPRVFQSQNGIWVVEYEYYKLHDEGIKERATYVFDTVIRLSLQKQSKDRLFKSVDKYKFITLKLKPNHHVFEKASIDSKVVYDTPNESILCVSSHRTIGLDEKSMFHYVVGLKPSVMIGYVEENSIEEVVEMDDKEIIANVFGLHKLYTNRSS